MAHEAIARPLFEKDVDVKTDSEAGPLSRRVFWLDITRLDLTRQSVPHRYHNVGAVPGRIIFTFTPSGIEKCFAQAANEPVRERRAAIVAEYGITMLA